MPAHDINPARALRKGTFGIGTFQWSGKRAPALIRADGTGLDLSEKFVDTHAVFDDWNDEDVAALLCAMLHKDGPIPAPIDMPRAVGLWYDSVQLAGEEIGISSSRAYSVNLRKTISLCVIDRTKAVAGTEVPVIWGPPGSAERRIRATVRNAPLKKDNRRIDLPAH